jgi:hypothetical protein
MFIFGALITILNWMPVNLFTWDLLINKEINIEYVINSEPIPRKSSYKHLGITINEKLSFSEQSNSIVKTCLKNGDILKNYAVM